MSNEFRALWDRMGLTYDDFIRTTEERHKRGVQKLFRRAAGARLHLQGHLLRPVLRVGRSLGRVARRPLSRLRPHHGNRSEENYFFKLSAFERKLLEFYEENPDFIAGDAAQ